MFLKSALTLFLATNASAFFISPAPGAVPRHFVSRHVSLSDSTTSSEVQSEAETPEDADVTMEVAAPAEEVAAPAEVAAVVASSEELEKPPVVKNTERHTLYVGNLPYGKCEIVPSEPQLIIVAQDSNSASLVSSVILLLII
jgi:hypothetical protein